MLPPSPIKMKIVVVGAGPAGLLMAHGLVQRSNYEVHVYERREDFRGSDPTSLRTYPIGLQQRGLQAADPALRDALIEAGVWINGVALQGKNPKKMARAPTLYIDRNIIVLTMLNHLSEKTKYGEGSSLHFHFEYTVEDLELDENIICVKAKGETEVENVSFDGLIAADGSGSKIRLWLAEDGELKVETKPIPNQYRTFSIPMVSYDGSITLDEDRVHGWMFGKQTVLMVPNGGVCSGVFIFPAGADPLKGLTSPEEVQKKFEKLSPESLGKFISKSEATDILDRPLNVLSSCKCDRMDVGDKVLFIGDSAHAVSASMGQACNSALQDVGEFMKVLESKGDHWKKSIRVYSKGRMQDAHALHELSDYSLPVTGGMRTEFIFRAIAKKAMPTCISKRMRSLPNELLSTTNLSYSEILEQTQWWTERVKKTVKAKKEKDKALKV